jgi:hypothetical protein
VAALKACQETGIPPLKIVGTPLVLKNQVDRASFIISGVEQLKNDINMLALIFVIQ